MDNNIDKILNCLTELQKQLEISKIKIEHYKKLLELKDKHINELRNLIKKIKKN